MGTRPTRIMKNKKSDRRPIAARESQYSQRVSSFLARAGVSPNAISIASMIFAIGAGASLVATSLEGAARVYWFLAAVLIVLRLSANMLDGMVALETGQTSAAGELFNEVPDRVSDVIIFVCAGYAAGGSPDLGYAAAILALFVAYVRALGNHMGVSQLFIGPMAKSHRMFTLAAFCLYYTFIPANWQFPSALAWGLLIICAGSIVTIIRRLRRIASVMAV